MQYVKVAKNPFIQFNFDQIMFVYYNHIKWRENYLHVHNEGFVRFDVRNSLGNTNI